MPQHGGRGDPLHANQTRDAAAADAAAERAVSSGKTHLSITYHAPRQKVATPAATAICRGRLPQGRMLMLNSTSSACASALEPEPGPEEPRRAPRDALQPRAGAEVEGVAHDVARPETSAALIASLHASDARRIMARCA